MEYENDRARAAFEFAYQSYVKTKCLQGFEPVAFVLGFSIYYEMKYFCREVYGASAWGDHDGKETLFGLPIRVTENNRYEVSLEISEFTYDFKKGE